MDKWLKIVDLWRQYHELSKVYSTHYEITLLSCIGAKLSGATMTHRLGEKNEIRSGSKESYMRLLKLVGEVEPSTGIQKSGATVKPVFIYRAGEKYDLRVHIFFIMETSMGKGRNLYVMEKLLEKLGVYSVSVSRPTNAKLVGTTDRVRVSGKEIELPAIPMMLDADLLILDECTNLFKPKTDPATEEVLASIRKCTEPMYSSSNNTLHNDSVKNTAISKFYGRSTIVASSFPSREVLAQINSGTLQRFMILSANLTKGYTGRILESKMMSDDEKLGREIEINKGKLLEEISMLINSACDAFILPSEAHINKEHPGYVYHCIKITKDTNNALIAAIMKRQIKLSEEENSQQSSFFTRGAERILKMAAIISIVNGKNYVGLEEALYAEELYFKNLGEVDKAICLFKNPHAEEVAKYTDEFRRIYNDLKKDADDKGKELLKGKIVKSMMTFWGIGEVQTLDRLKIIRIVSFVDAGERNHKKVVVEEGI